MRNLLSTALCVAVLTGCSSEASPGADASVDAAGDASAPTPDAPTSDAPDPGACIEATLEAFRLESYDDVSVRYVARIRPNVEGRPFDLLLESRHIGATEFVGTFPLGTGDDANLDTCAHCLIAIYGSMTDRGYFARSGTLTLRRDPFDLAVDMVLDDVELEEVTIDGFVTTPVPGGGCIHLAHVDVAQTFGPPGWTCGENEFDDHTQCDCECGILDYDCSDPSLPIDGCGPGQLCRPILSGVIGPFSGDSVCASDCDRASGALCPGGQVCVPHALGDLCVADAQELDRLAAVGAACNATATYCGIVAGAATGFCDRSARADGVCRPMCSVDADCDEAASEVCHVVAYDTSSAPEVPFGFCAQRHPAEWTCAPAAYEDGATCDCGCGTYDPDCFVAPPLPVVGCAAGEVCMDGSLCAPPP